MSEDEDDDSYYAREKLFHETKYLAGDNPRAQSGFGRNAEDWERYRRSVVGPIRSDGTFLDIGCASGLLMEDVQRWAREDGFVIEPYGLDISEKLAAVARARLPWWGERIFVGNAFDWRPPFRFDYVRTELVYVPQRRRREYVAGLLERVVAPEGALIACSYGSSRPEGARGEALVEELAEWNIDGVYDVVSPEHGFVITRAVSVRARPRPSR